MYYQVLADVVVFIHFLWILFLVFGFLCGVRSVAAKLLHVSGLVFAIVIQVFGWYCPLTHLEVWLRRKSGPSPAYSGSFIVHYAEKLVYLELGRPAIFVMTLLLCAATAWFYMRSPRERR